ncbi:fasciclin domain-containing protein [Mariniflexile soesokkakense]|uniref:Fasciclin domain-containing protein n=1 Tax=Mariniflexile soesokkakense TaxID=1343160 RepID=A0ABV0A8S8_9FLAO
MKNLFNLHNLLRLSLTVVVTIFVLNCTSEKFKESTDETLNITEFLKANKADYSLFLEILEITDYASFMNTYGTYTLFLPSNEAVTKLLNDLGVNSVKDVPLEDLKELAKLHILSESVNTTSFTDGKIASPSLQGQFLITGATFLDGVSSITVNKEARISNSNIIVGNGIIHVLDKVLRVANKTLAKSIEEDTSLSLFTEALKVTGWYDKLNLPVTYDKDSISSHLSVLVQTDAVFQNSGLNTIEDLKTKYSHLNDPMNPLDSLNLFVAYRILPGLNYLADLAVTPAALTKAPLEVISFKLVADSLLINQETFNGVLEKGVEINRSNSDVTASNGVLHYVKDNFFIKKRFPLPVYFDLGDQPEIRQLSSVFRKPGNFVSLKKSELSGVDWPDDQSLTYSAASIGDGAYLDRAWHGDIIELLRFRNGFLDPITFTTPVIIKGKYKVWVSYRTNERSSPATQVSFNGEPLSRMINFREYGNTTEPERVLESQGYKRHIEPSTNRFNCRLVGIVDVPTTGRHKLTFEAIQDSSNGQTWLDVVEFRPIDMDQLYPKFQAGGDGLIYQ